MKAWEMPLIKGVDSWYHCFSDIVETDLGPFCVAFDTCNHNLLAVIPSSNDQEAWSKFEKRFPKLLHMGGRAAQLHLNQLFNIVEDLLNGKSNPLPSIELLGTPFQQKVWEELLNIPRGMLVDYKTIANSIGNPEASRAVANACGANPIAVLIPCHRVIRSDGSGGGYRWGIQMKRDLLKREGFAL
jgi:AraC family transcriptional regulator of adaptative response/methylated-DNA-[protein]-cysteine methyltransferase